jgi:hypothetical protein
VSLRGRDRSEADTAPQTGEIYSVADGLGIPMSRGGSRRLRRGSGGYDYRRRRIGVSTIRG